MNEYLFKVLVIGDAGVGKTSVIKRYVHNEFNLKYKYTIGVDFAMKQLDWSDDTVVRIQLWDIAGQERFSSMTRIYYREAVAALIVFDVTNPRSFDAVKNWKADLDTKVQLPDGRPIPVMLLANKCDMPHHPLDLEDYAKQNKYIGWAATSAKVGNGIETAMDTMLRNIMEAVVQLGIPDLPPASPRNNTIELEQIADEGKKEDKCAC